MRIIIGLAALGSLLFCSSLATQAQDKKELLKNKEPLVARVKTSIDLGVRYLRSTQLADGSWEVNLPTAGIQGGWSSLALLALLNAGIPVNDPVVERGLKYLRSLEPTMTYVR